LAWFVIESDITARETPRETRLSFFTVLLVRERTRPPDQQEARALIDEYLREIGAPLAWDIDIVAIADITP
jgi:hypothetical protein